MIFVSHASQDRPALGPLLNTLHTGEVRVWIDDEVSGGEAWWHTILDSIRSCRVFVFALSSNSLASKPCLAELRYAQALQRPILPVQIGPAGSVRLTPLATTQILDYRRPTDRVNTKLLSAIRAMQAQAGPLPTPSPDEPPVPFAYLMKLAGIIKRPALSAGEQAEAVSELRVRLAEDHSDPSACNDIVQLCYLLRDRPDVTWRTRTDVDTILETTGLDPAGVGDAAMTAPLSGPRPAIATTVSDPRSDPDMSIRARQTVVPDARPEGPAGRRSLRPYTRLLVSGLVGALLGGVIVAGVKVVNRTTGPHVEAEESKSVLLGDADVNAIMGTADMAVVERSEQNAKPSGSVDVSPADCMSVIYPGLDRSYADSGYQQLSWAVLEKPGGLQRAGVHDNLFADQNVAAFPDEESPRALVDRLAGQWEQCADKTATVSYPDRSTYVWTIGQPTSQASRIVNVYGLEGSADYRCQRVLDAVRTMVIDVRACGESVDDEAVRMADRLVATATQAPSF